MTKALPSVGPQGTHAPLDDHLRCWEGNSKSNFNKKITCNRVKAVLIFSPIHHVRSQAFAGSLGSSITHLQRAWNLFIFYYLQPHHHHHVLEFGPAGDPKEASGDADEQQKALASTSRQHEVPCGCRSKLDSYPSCWFSPTQRTAPGSGLK